MYYYVRGTIVEVYIDSVVVDVSGIGYHILMSHPEVYSVGQTSLIYVSHIVREDEQYYVGFSSLEEKDLFNKLIDCKGIGPKTALNALRDITIEEFIDAINNSDVKRLKKLPGIGPKAASQIILDLQGILKVEENKATLKLNKAQEDAKSALKNLGFKVKDIEECIKKINDDSLSTEQYVTQILKMIRKG